MVCGTRSTTSVETEAYKLAGSFTTSLAALLSLKRGDLWCSELPAASRATHQLPATFIRFTKIEPSVFEPWV